MNKTRPAGPCLRGYQWCVNEETRASADGSPARFHLGARSVVPAGDDAIACLLVASEDLHSERYLEVEFLSDGQCWRSVWLSVREAAALGAAIAASVEVAAEPAES